MTTPFLPDYASSSGDGVSQSGKTPLSNNTIIHMIFGSHLYGLDTPASDLDYKGVYKASAKDLFFGEAKDTITQNTKKGNDSRNSSTDVDIEVKELKRFLFDCMSGQMYALDMLFAPESAWLETSWIWEEVTGVLRPKLISKNVLPYLAYVREQASKYGIKGSRVNLAQTVLELCVGLGDSKKVYELAPLLPEDDLVEFSEREDCQGTLIPSVSIIRKQFNYNAKVKLIRECMEKFLETFGKRAIEAANNQNVDWKAMSHALRACFQAEELLATGHMTLPLIPEHRDISLQCKQGNMSFAEAKDILEFHMVELENISKTSTLQELPDVEYVKDWLYNLYFNWRPK